MTIRDDAQTVLQQAISAIRPPDSAATAAALARHEQLTKPRGSLGRLELLGVQLAGIQRQSIPAIREALVVVAAGDHGIAAEGVSAYPQEVTGQMLLNFLSGGAAINVLARAAGARLILIDAGSCSDIQEQPGLLVRRVRAGTGNFSREPAMTRAEAFAALKIGLDLAAEEAANGVDLLAVGEMGIANTTAASAIVAALSGRPAAEVTGRGTGVDDAAWQHKCAVITAALELHAPESADPIGVLSAVGGFEIAALAGAIIGGAAAGMAVLLDGFITGAAALTAYCLAPAVQPYLIAAHRSVEPGHRVVLETLDLEPLLDLGLRLGEGSGAALAIPIVRAAAAILAEMATFESASVSRSET
jgi:nicotinate-nucleotide--dimethylbenzimidazole phosphoribosyltransferase